MEELNFPVIKGPTPPPKTLSMDEYLKFVIFNLRHTVDIKACRELKSRKTIVPFSLK